MSLFSSIQLASNSLNAAQTGLQVVGQNIANSNTPGYIREELVLTAAPTQRKGNLLLGLGVEVQAVVQKIDTFLEERLRGATSDRVSAEVQEDVYLQLESLIGELSDTDLSTSLNNFFNSVSEVLNQPEDVSVRNLAILQGQTLTSDVKRVASRVQDLHSELDKRVVSIAGDINTLTSQIAKLNVQIVNVEGGTTSGSDAVGLRDQRLVALTKLSELVDIQVREQGSGAVSVYAGGEYIVFEGLNREVDVAQVSENGQFTSEIQLADIGSPLALGSGEAGGLAVARDIVLGGFIDGLDNFASTLAFEFNKLFSSGQGLTGYESLTSEFRVDDAELELDAAGLNFTPVNGSFDVITQNTRTAVAQTTQVRVDLNGLDGDSSLQDIAAAIDAIDGVTASITTQNRLQIASDSAETVFAFGDDTSGLLAALGVNTFFSGTSALTLGVNQTLRNDPTKFAASAGGIGQDSENAVLLGGFLDRKLESANGQTLSVLYDGLVSKVTQGSTVAQGVADGFRVFEATLNGQKLSVSGVSIDEEAVQMLGYQRMYQASARYISTLSDLLDILVNL